MAFVQMGNAALDLSDDIRIKYAALSLTGNAASWWYVMVQSSNIPTTWNEFVEAVRQEFIPRDSQRRARDKLRALSHKISVSSFLDEF